jgi:hypothetical protein
MGNYDTFHWKHAFFDERIPKKFVQFFWKTIGIFFVVLLSKDNELNATTKLLTSRNGMKPRFYTSYVYQGSLEDSHQVCEDWRFLIRGIAPRFWLNMKG